MSDADDDLTERLLDLLVYAPLGLALEAKELIPQLAERGRGQVALTRLAATVGARRAEQQAGSILEDLSGAIATFVGGAATPSSTEPPVDPPIPPAADFPIDGYEGLTAVEVVRLLADLDDHELEIVEAYERENRGRSTVLNRIRQRLG